MYKLYIYIHSPFTCKSAGMIHIDVLYIVHVTSPLKQTWNLETHPVVRKKNHPLVFVGSVSPTWSCSLYGNLKGAETPKRWVSMGLCNF